FPVGYPFLGQVILHDATPTATTPLAADHPRPLNLASIYGRRPSALYCSRDPDRLRVGLTRARETSIGIAPTGSSDDLPRTSASGDDGWGSEALIADRRNCDNLVLAQLHVAFLKFHNAVLERARASGADGQGAFADAARVVIWHFQWIILNDFLRRLIAPDIFERFSPHGSPAARAARRDAAPAELAAAAFRVGHASARSSYDVNAIFCTSGRGPASLEQLRRLTAGNGRSGPLASKWVVDWRRFFALAADPMPQPSRRFDPFIVPALHAVSADGALPKLDLVSGYSLALPSGQDIARRLGLKPLPTDVLAAGDDGATAARHGMHRSTPLLYYLLKEAQHCGGEHLGPVGSFIFAIALFGLIEGDAASFRRSPEPWAPTLPSATPGRFDMADLLHLAAVGELAPEQSRSQPRPAGTRD
ncbi:MAG: peroxidase family protein, partial [Alphaproteobacteria bacterium]